MPERYVIAFHVEVECEGTDEWDAIVRANAACDWPGAFSPPLSPAVHTGTLNRSPVEAKVTRSRALMVKRSEEAL